MEIRKSDIVRSIENPSMTYKVLSIGPKRAKLQCNEPGFRDLRCNAQPDLLRLLAQAPSNVRK